MRISVTIHSASSDSREKIRDLRGAAEKFVRDIHDWNVVRITEREAEIRVDGISADTSEASSA